MATAQAGVGTVAEAPDDGRDGWWNVACAFVMLFAALGIPAIMVPVLYAPIIDETGWSRGDVALLTTFKFGAGAVAAYLTGPLVDRYGIRKVTIACAVLSGAALLMLLEVHSLPMLYLIGVLLGISALGVMTAMKVLVSQWFTRNQGLALGIALTGVSAAGVVIPYSTTLLTEAYGWRVAGALMSLVIWFVAIPLFLWRAREHASQGNEVAKLAAEADYGDAPAFRDIRFTRFFLVAAFVSVLIGMVDHGMSAHLVIFLDRDVHLGAEIAAIGFSAIMVMSNLGKLGFGWLFDRLSTRGIGLCCLALSAGVALAFPVAGLSTFLLFAVVYGPTQGGLMVSLPVLAKHCFGPRAMTRAIAVLSTTYMVGSAAGPAIAGYLYDLTGSYAWPFGIFIVSIAVAGFAAMTLRPAYRPARA
ncbi:MFS transporter [Sphingosinicella sp. LHD-64]|uniref:MFS transporter n=1 Tax=Sphingosinicella sp. LHD-64 TaxID=3072139 RepID=UPI00280ECD79|nr:MFS transporter [Sphingosinicella sp. LHD-64]MDQ8756517.1 MFS transporter [Sphingosinicella sp. LHD-64]